MGISAAVVDPLPLPLPNDTLAGAGAMARSSVVDGGHDLVSGGGRARKGEDSVDSLLASPFLGALGLGESLSGVLDGGHDDARQIRDVQASSQPYSSALDSGADELLGQGASIGFSLDSLG